MMCNGSKGCTQNGNQADSKWLAVHIQFIQPSRGNTFFSHERAILIKLEGFQSPRGKKRGSIAINTSHLGRETHKSKHIQSILMWKPWPSMAFSPVKWHPIWQASSSSSSTWAATLATPGWVSIWARETPWTTWSACAFFRRLLEVLGCWWCWRVVEINSADSAEENGQSLALP